MRVRVSEGGAVRCRDTAIHVASAWDPSPGTLEHPQIPENVNQPSKVGRIAWAEGMEGAAARG